MVILEFADNFIFVRFVCTEPGVFADGGDFVRPGDEYAGFTYEELRELGAGRHDLEALAKDRERS